jgi:hypothetical protein
MCSREGWSWEDDLPNQIFSYLMKHRIASYCTVWVENRIFGVDLAARPLSV